MAYLYTMDILNTVHTLYVISLYTYSTQNFSKIIAQMLPTYHILSYIAAIINNQKLYTMENLILEKIEQLLGVDASDKEAVIAECFQLFGNRIGFLPDEESIDGITVCHNSGAYGIYSFTFHPDGETFWENFVEYHYQ